MDYSDRMMRSSEDQAMSIPQIVAELRKKADEMVNECVPDSRAAVSRLRGAAEDLERFK